MEEELLKKILVELHYLERTILYNNKKPISKRIVRKEHLKKMKQIIGREVKKGKSFQKIGEQLGLTRQRVHQIYKYTN